MKRTILAAGLALTAAAIYFGNLLWAQNPTPAPAMAPPLRTRIALVNINQVLKSYRKADEFNKTFTERLKNLETTQLLPYKTQINKLQNENLLPTTTPAQKEANEKEIRRLQLAFQEKQEELRKSVATEYGNMTVQLYREIESAVVGFARSHDYELVLFHRDPTNPANPYDPATIQQKLSAGGTMPMYAAPNMDITEAIIQMLNRQVPATAPTGAAPPQPR